jgi:hypothetical protein
LPEKPIVIGHSLAGLVVQKLIEMDKAVAGICIDGAVLKNIINSIKIEQEKRESLQRQK